MQTSDHRSSKRFALPHDRAQALVVNGSQESRAIIADTSATGVGLLMLRGTAISVGTRIKLVTEEGIADCQVIHTRKEESFLHVGIRRLSEVPFDELPEYRKPQQFFRQSMGSASPLIFLGVVLGFSSVMIGMVLIVDVASSRNAQQAEVEETRLRAVDAYVEEVKEVELLEPNLTPRQIAAAEVNGYLDSAGEALDKFKSRHVQMISTVLEGTGLQWEEVTQKLRITPAQEAQIRAALEADPIDQTVVITRARVMSFLDSEQRAGFSRILAAVTTSG